MMKRVLILLAVFALLCGRAGGIDAVAREGEILGASALERALPQDAAELMDDTDPLASADFSGTAQRILSDALSGAGGSVKNALRTAALVLLAVTLCGILEGLPLGRAGLAVSLAGAAAVAGICMGDLRALIGLGESTIEKMSEFSKLLLPVLAGAAAASGGTASGAAIYAATTLGVSFLTSFVSGLLVPLTAAYAALATADAGLGNGALGGITKLTGDVIQKSLRILVFVFTAYLSLTGILSGTADAVTVKAAKMTVSTAVPVVGSLISDASEAVLASARVVGSSVGVFGMLAVLSIMIVPTVQIGVQYLILRLTAALSTVICGKKLAGLVESMARVMGFLLAMTAGCALMLYVGIICFLKVSVL